MEKKVKLTVLGFSFNQTQSGTYGLVLGEEEGLRRLMIIIGTPEAQSIAFKLHDTLPPRPLTHDLFQVLLSRFDIKLNEIVIYKYDNGVFFSRLLFISSDNSLVTIESRTSDAIAIALRTDSPIYTTESIMQELAIVFDESLNVDEDGEYPVGNDMDEDDVKKYDYSFFKKKDLENMLLEAIEGEDYELASVLRDEIEKKKRSEGSR